MIVLEYIFYLCIVYMVFNFIWWFVVQLPKTLLFGLKQHFAVDHSIKAIRYLFISTITYSTAVQFLADQNDQPSVVLGVLISGGMILTLYLAGKLNKKQNLFRFAASVSTNFKFGNPLQKTNELTYEKHLVGISIVVYAACVGLPETVGYFLNYNPVNYWFLTTIDDIYQAPILKWIFGFAGIIFMLSMIQRGVVYTQLLFLKLSGKEPPQKKNPLDHMMKEFEKMNHQTGGQSTEKVDLEDDLYVDFEEMDEEDEDKS